MHEFFSGALSELLKGFAGEAGKAGARALFSSRAEDTSGQHSVQFDALQEPKDLVDGFLNALAHRDQDAAWTYCDQTWADDPARSESLHVTLDAAPPLSWAIQEVYVPADWAEGNWLAWAIVEVVVTFPGEGGGFDVIPAHVTTFNGDTGWHIADVHWSPGEENEQVELPTGRVIGWKDWESAVDQYHVLPCSRCSQEFLIPAGYGMLKVKCPACWTQQEVET